MFNILNLFLSIVVASGCVFQYTLDTHTFNNTDPCTVLIIKAANVVDSYMGKKKKMGSAAIAILVVLGLCSVPASAVQCGAGSSSISETGDITAEMCPEDNTYCEPCDVPPVCMFNIKVACHCKACPSDTHSDGSALVYRNGCIPDTFCGAGERLSSESCISCSANQYQSESRHRKTACALQSYCNAGTYLHGASSATQGTCKACRAQYYQSSNRHFST